MVLNRPLRPLFFSFIIIIFQQYVTITLDNPSPEAIDLNYRLNGIPRLGSHLLAVPTAAALPTTRIYPLFSVEYRADNPSNRFRFMKQNR